MKDLTKKYYSKEEILDAAKADNISEKYFDELIQYIEEDIQQATADGDLSEDEIRNSSLSFGLDYINKYIKEIETGHSKEWARIYSRNFDSHRNGFEEAYQLLRAKDREIARKELNIYCQSIGADEYYTRYFIKLMEDLRSSEETDPDTQAANYSRIYKEQMSAGRSNLFAHLYAELKADDELVEDYCYWYAKSYEDAIQKGKSEEYAKEFANKMGHYYADYYGRYDENKELDAENHEYNERQILGYMNAWEYTIQNNLIYSDKFIDFYDNIYINTYYADDRDYSIKGEDLDVDILRRALEKYSAYLDRQNKN